MTRPTPAEIKAQAPELIADLTPHVGNPAAVTATLDRWLDRVGPATLTLIGLAALADVFAEYLTTVPADQLEPGDIAHTLPEGN